VNTISQTSLLSIGILGAGFVAAAAIAVAPSATFFENDQVKVVMALEKTHVKGKAHEHKMNRVMIYLQPGRQRFEYQDGRKPAEFGYKAGEVKWSPPEGMHSPEVISNEPFNIVEVELKKPGTGKKITVPLDPVKIDPKHYKVELENDQVRVIRAHMGPHDSVPMHEHSLNRVTVFLTDQNIRSTGADGKVTVGQHKAGEAIWSPPITHKEENLNDQPFEVIAVEIKN
jgi:beta-alanine degradation protein BauB